MDIVRKGTQKTGESLPTNDVLKMAKELGEENPNNIIESDLEGPAKDAVAQLQKSGKAVGEVYSILFS